MWIFPEARKIFPKGKKISKVAKKFIASEGILSGAIAFGLFWGLKDDSTLFVLCSLAAAIATGIYDGLKIHSSIFFIKSVPAFLAIVAILARSMA